MPSSKQCLPFRQGIHDARKELVTHTLVCSEVSHVSRVSIIDIRIDICRWSRYIEITMAATREHGFGKLLRIPRVFRDFRPSKVSLARE